MLFAITAITSPILGAILSAPITKCVGGQKSKWLLPTIFIVGLLGVASSVFVPEPNDVNYVIGLVWLFMFFGAIVLPVQTGVMLTCVKPEDRPTANSLANVAYNLLGYYPAPIIYGLACKIDGEEKSRWGMKALMYASVLMPILIFATILAKRGESSDDDLDDDE